MTEKKSFKEYNFQEILFEMALYSKLTIDLKSYTSYSYDDPIYENGMEYERHIYQTNYSQDFQHLIDFMRTDKNIMGYCPMCKTSLSLHPYPINIDASLASPCVYAVPDDMFNDEEGPFPDADYEMSKIITGNLLPKHEIFMKEVSCTHSQNHIFRFIFKINVQMSNTLQVENISLEKIGQYPSINDFSSTLDEYKKILDNNYIKELNRALGLKSHGVGIGSFIYLRRIFEKLIFEKADEKAAATGSAFKLEEFKVLRMEEKIDSLKNELPKNLVDNSKFLYGILSKGIHQLEEDECLLYFDVVYLAIKNILDEKIRMKKQEENESKVKKELQKISSKLK